MTCYEETSVKKFEDEKGCNDVEPTGSTEIDSEESVIPTEKKENDDRAGDGDSFDVVLWRNIMNLFLDFVFSFHLFSNKKNSNETKEQENARTRCSLLVFILSFRFVKSKKKFF